MRIHQVTGLVAAAVLGAAPGARAGEGVLTLPEALQAALQDSPALASARASLAAAGYRVDGAVTGFLPVVTASAGYRRATQNSAGSSAVASAAGAAGGSLAGTRTSGTSYDNWSTSLGLQQTIWDFGRTLGPLQAARAQDRAEAARLQASVQDVMLQVGTAYLQVLAADATVEAARESRRQMAEHLAAARDRFEAGLRPRIDVTRAEADLASAELALVQAVNGERTARVALATAMGRPGLGPVALVAPDPTEPPGAEDLDASVKEALANRPQRRALQEQVAAARAQVSAARGGYFPSLGANAGLTYTGEKVKDLAWNWYVGASLNWNLVSGIVGAHAGEREARAGVTALQADLLALDNAIRAEVENAEVAWREARQKQEPARALLAAATETLEQAQARYAVGSGNVTEVADAQATLVKARASRIQADLDLQVARLFVMHALGRLGGVASVQ